MPLPLRKPVAHPGTRRKPLRAALLSRVSTDRQHVTVQTRRLLTEAACRGYDVVHFEETVVSGRKMDRPGLNRVLALAEGGEIDVLLVAELSRIGRSLSGVARVVERLSKAGCALVSLREQTLPRIATSFASHTDSSVS